MPGVPLGTFGQFGMPAPEPARGLICGSPYRAPRGDKVRGASRLALSASPAGWPSQLARPARPACREEGLVVPEEPHPARLQVLRLRYLAPPRVRHHLRRRTERVG